MGLEIRSPERIGDAAIASAKQLEQLEVARTVRARPSSLAPLSVF